MSDPDVFYKLELTKRALNDAIQEMYSLIGKAIVEDLDVERYKHGAQEAYKLNANIDRIAAFYSDLLKYKGDEE